MKYLRGGDFRDELFLVVLSCLLSGCLGSLERIEPAELPVAEQPIFIAPDRVTSGGLRADYPFLPGENGEATVSVGSVTTGYLVNGHRLEFPGQQYSFLPVQWGRGILFGTEEMVALLSFASEKVAEEIPGTVTWLGNICLQNGGDIPYSVSHNSGRDADIAFFYASSDGDQHHPSDLLPVGEDLYAVDGAGRVLFDTARNWIMVESLINHEEISVQFLFISSELEEALLNYAASQGVDRATLRRAERILSQPGGSNPHSDHLHLRLYCSDSDALGGCEDSGRVHPWVNSHVPSRREAMTHYIDLLHSQEASVRAASIQRLILMGEQLDPAFIGPLLLDESPLVRISAAEGLASTSVEEGYNWIEEALEIEEDELVLGALVRALGSMSPEEAGRILIGLLMQADEGREFSNYVMGQIVNEMGTVQAVDAVPLLIELMQQPDPMLRARAAWSLSRLTGEALEAFWLDPEMGALPSRSSLVHRGRALGAESGMASGTSDTVPSSMGEPVDEERLGEWVLEILDERMHVSYLAQLRLMHVLQHQAPSLNWPRSDAYAYWARVVSQQ